MGTERRSRGPEGSSRGGLEVPRRGPSLGVTSAIWGRLISVMLTLRSPEKTLLPPGSEGGGGAWGPILPPETAFLLDGSKTEIQAYV